MGRTTTNTLVIGGGQAGLATARHLQRTGTDVVVLDASSGPGGSWPYYYDSLHLFSPARFSGLPGLRFPGHPDRYPHRDEVSGYLARYAAHLDADLRFGHRVDSLRASEDEFRARGEGFEVSAQRVVVASGSFGAPHTPAVPGLGTFEGDVLHAANYRNPENFVGRRVSVVGAGNSAIQIAAELATVTDVVVYSRRPIRWRRQRVLGRDLHWWLSGTHLDRATFLGPLLPTTVPVLDDGRYRAAFRGERLKWRPMFDRVEGADVISADGSANHADVLLFATGYQPHVPFLAGTSAIDDRGQPLHRAGISSTIAGLGYVGLEYQRSLASATLRGVGRDAHAVVRHLRAG